MITQKRAAAWRLDRTALPVLAASMLLASTLPLTAQTRSRPNDSSDAGRHAEPRSAPSYNPPSQPSHTPPSQPSGDSGGDRDSGRHARPAPRDDSPDRQPSHNRGGRGGHDGRYYGGGYYGGSHYGPGYYWGPSWWWYFWGPYDYWYPGYTARDYRSSGDAGALDLDVSPAKTEVYVDGQYIGRVDSYDGWPQYLWLPKGTYDLVLFREGYRTIARQVTLYPGVVMAVDDRMEPGESVRPEDLVTKTHDRRDERIRFERERSERIDRGERGDNDSEDWRNRRERWRDRDQDRDRDDDDAEESIRDRGADESNGRVRLEIEPEDASVYLDGKFVGTGADLARLRAGLVLDPGKHRLAVVRPGHRSQEMDFDVEAGEELDLEVELEATDSGR
jgi:hypothetical protein